MIPGTAVVPSVDEAIPPNGGLLTGVVDQSISQLAISIDFSHRSVYKELVDEANSQRGLTINLKSLMFVFYCRKGSGSSVLVVN